MLKKILTTFINIAIPISLLVVIYWNYSILVDRKELNDRYKGLNNRYEIVVEKQEEFVNEFGGISESYGKTVSEYEQVIDEYTLILKKVNGIVQDKVQHIKELEK